MKQNNTLRCERIHCWESRLPERWNGRCPKTICESKDEVVMVSSKEAPKHRALSRAFKWGSARHSTNDRDAACSCSCSRRNGHSRRRVGCDGKRREPQTARPPSRPPEQVRQRLRKCCLNCTNRKASAADIIVRIERIFKHEPALPIARRPG